MQTRNKPQFLRDSENKFYQQLKEQMKQVITSKERNAVAVTWAKVICYPALYLLFYSILLTRGQNPFVFYSCYSILGILVTLIVFNIVHDAVHHALFRKQSLNRRASLLLDFLGGNSFVWGKRHVLYHHTFTNVPGWDIDIRQSEIVKFNPHQTHKKLYRFQHFYMPLLYLFYSLNWILVRDFKDFFNQKSLVKQKTKIALAEYIKLFAFKIFYFAFILIVPILVLKMHWYQYLFGFVVMHWLTSALTLLVLLPSHLDEDAQFPEPDENLYLHDTWAIHQLKVTNDFGTNEPILNFLMGGLNHHIAHHLFPTINHNIIPHITKHIAIRAKENNLPYKCYTLRQVMISHFKLLKKCGQIDFFEE